MNKQSGTYKVVTLILCLVLLVNLSACKPLLSAVKSIGTSEPIKTLEQNLPFSQSSKTVATVNSEKITVDQFEKRVRLERLTLEQTFLNYQLSAFSQYFQSQLLDVQNKLDDTVQFGSDVLDKMIKEDVIDQKAKELGLTVTDGEIDQTIEENYGFYANGTPTPTATFEYRPTSTYSPVQLKMVTPVAPAENSPTATPATSGETSPTPTTYTREMYNNLYATVMANLDTQTGYGNADFRNHVRSVIYGQKLYDFVTKDVSTEQDMVWVRHILVATQDDAQKVIDQLHAGADFSDLAARYSTDTASNTTGGDLGWIYKGQMVPEFEDAAWALKVGEISQPVKSQYGYHVILVLGHEKRQLSAEQLNSVKSTIYQNYLDQIQKAAKITKFNIWQSVVPSDPSIPTEYRISVPSK